jgi:hypothetical protein
MSWHPYELDNHARNIVKLQTKESIKECYRMRQTIAYGLERFWGEQYRLEGEDQFRADYWSSVWNKLVNILAEGGVILPQHQDVDMMANELWKLDMTDQQIALAVLTQFCDCLIWWTQRYKSQLPD